LAAAPPSRNIKCARRGFVATVRPARRRLHHDPDSRTSYMTFLSKRLFHTHLSWLEGRSAKQAQPPLESVTDILATPELSSPSTLASDLSIPFSGVVSTRRISVLRTLSSRSRAGGASFGAVLCSSARSQLGWTTFSPSFFGGSRHDLIIVCASITGSTCLAVL
jgi:hypothetical protein